MVIHAFHPKRSRLPNDQIVNDLERAKRIMRDDPDLAALHLDGALRELLALAAERYGANSAHPDAALLDLDRREPLLAQRFRLALRAPSPEARLIHCWSLLDSLSLDALPEAPRAHALKG